MYIFPIRFSCLRGNILHTCSRQSKSRFLFRAGSHQTIRLHIWPRWNVCTRPVLKLCRLSSRLRKHLHPHAWISLNKMVSTGSISLSVLPEAFVLGSIGPDLHSETPTYISHPLAMIYNPIFKLNRLPLFDLIGPPRCSGLVAFPSEVGLILVRDAGSTAWRDRY